MEVEVETELHGDGEAPVPSISGVLPPKKGMKKILDRNLAASLDVAKLSDRNAALVLTPALKILGHDPAEYNINPNSIRRERAKHRLNIAENLKVEFTPEVPLTIHWDGKLLEDIVGNEIVDRLPILVSGMGVDQLLAVPKLKSGTGEAAATAVYEAAIEWGITDNVKCLGFDTTSVNTGSRNGANPLKRVTVEIANIQSKGLEDFVTSNTHRFFNITGFSSDFLTKDVNEWAEDKAYNEVKQGVRNMRVVNDIAERGVKLMDEYNKLHTNNEEQKQFLLLVVKDYRKKYPDRKKSTLMK